MTTKRTHGPCNCHPGIRPAHYSDCPSLYPTKQEPDALTRLARLIRTTVTLNAASEEQALALISEAREEQRRALVRTANEGLEHAASVAEGKCPDVGLPCDCDAHVIAYELRALKDPEP